MTFMTFDGRNTQRRTRQKKENYIHVNWLLTQIFVGCIVFRSFYMVDNSAGAAANWEKRVVPLKLLRMVHLYVKRKYQRTYWEWLLLNAFASKMVRFTVSDRQFGGCCLSNVFLLTQPVEIENNNSTKWWLQRWRLHQQRKCYTHFDGSL